MPPYLTNYLVYGYYENMKSFLIVGIVIALILVICIVPLRDEAYAVTVNYQEAVTKYVSLNYEVNDYMRTDIIEVQVACLDIKNTDDVAGDFMIIIYGFADGCIPFSQNFTLGLNVSEQKTVEYQAEVIDGWDYRVIPNVKKIETGEFVAAQRQEIQFKKVSALDYLLYFY